LAQASGSSHLVQQAQAMATSKMTQMVSFFLLYLGMLVGVRGVRDFVESEIALLDVKKQTCQRGIETSRRGHLVMQASGPPDYCVGVNADKTWNVTELTDTNKCQSNSRFFAVPGHDKANESFFLMNYDTGYVISCPQQGASVCSLINASQVADMTADGDAVVTEFYFSSVAGKQWFYILNTDYGMTASNEFNHTATYADYQNGKIHPPISLQITADSRYKWQFRFENVISKDFCDDSIDCSNHGGRKLDFEWIWCSQPCLKAHCCKELPAPADEINKLWPKSQQRHC